MTESKEISFSLRGEYITLDALLKAAGIASSGGEAKARITEGQVTVDGAAETRRGRKLRGGELVETAGKRIRVVAPAAPAAEAEKA
ncbi:RNA-binding S4 domain-containing protein [Sutterella sp.]|uniref:RNA-binding S4 domain-containing protein n=1 Tax=Sutterella sp. TaxID=1981025 RepID=UPI0026DF0AFE|nr:RNA-binding S4 domain-containing protein [Sutterella sp.]MDO5532939.1 RNA-binding S4 domain-containing protein [Sutterella sp.]